MMRRTATRTFLNLDTINPAVVKAQYAVRGPIVARAGEIQAQLKSGTGSYPFEEVIMCNIGNPQALLQTPMTFPRQVLSLVVNPKMLEDKAIRNAFPADAVERAEWMLKSIGDWRMTGAYTDSKGYLFVRQSVADFIQNRDNKNAGRDLGPCDPDGIVLSNGASPAVAMALQALISGGDDGLMIPIPQYPLYSASLALGNSSVIPYYLDESKGWAMTVESLEKSYAAAVDKGLKPKGLAVINPGNPTGQVLDAAVIDDVIRFAYSKKLTIISDEVYQENVYAPGKKFHSFRERLLGLGGDIATKQQLVSLHTTSKGIIGECGRRGGYGQFMNFDEDLMKEFIKLPSVRLCPNVDGQLYVNLMLSPPAEGGPSYASDKAERDSLFGSLRERAAYLAPELNKIPGITSNPIEGAMYAFPKLTLPEKYIEYAVSKGKTRESADSQWVLELLENTGVLVVPGSGFGQEPGTYHFRTTILPPQEKLEKVVDKINTFQQKIIADYA